MLGKFSCFLSSDFLKINFFEKIFQEHHRKAKANLKSQHQIFPSEVSEVNSSGDKNIKYCTCPAGQLTLIQFSSVLQAHALVL